MKANIIFNQEVLDSITALNDNELVEKLERKNDYNQEFYNLLKEEAQKRRIEFKEVIEVNMPKEKIYRSLVRSIIKLVLSLFVLFIGSLIGTLINGSIGYDFKGNNFGNWVLLIGILVVITAIWKYKPK
jgi:hypothetical protein